MGAGILGLLAGVFIYDAFLPALSGLGGDQRFVTLAMLLDVPYGYLALAFGAMFLGLSVFLDRFDPAKKFDQRWKDQPLLRREWGWLSTGVIAGLLIAFSAFQGEYLSFSGGFLAAVAYLASSVGQPLQSVPTLSESVVWRALLVVGLIPGALLSSLLAGTVRQEKVTPLFQAAFGARVSLRVITVFLGGVLMIVGALMGGGCTTGAFMSGWPTLSVGSFVMGMTFFGAAMLTAHALYFGRYRLVHEVKDREKLDWAND